MMCCHHLDRSGRLEARAERLVRMEVPARANGSGRMEKLARMERLERAEGPGWAKVPGRAKRPGRPRGSPLQYTRPAHHLWNIVGGLCETLASRLSSAILSGRDTRSGRWCID